MVTLEGRPDFPLLEHWFDPVSGSYFTMGEGDDTSNLIQASSHLLRQPVVVGLARGEAAGKHFHNIDYKTELTSKLQRRDTLTHGLLVKVEFFADVAKTERVLTVDRKYNLDPAFGLVSKRTVRTYYCVDGFPHLETKDGGEYFYTPAENMAGVARYRENIVNEIKSAMMNSLPSLAPSAEAFNTLYDDGNSLMADLYPSISRYIASGNYQTIIDYVLSAEGVSAHPLLLAPINETINVAGFIAYSLENA